MRIYTKDNFPKKTSIPSYFWTWAFRVFLILILVLVGLFLFAIPLLLTAIYSYGVIILLIGCYLLVIFAIFQFIKHVRKAKNNVVQQVTVDSTGVHYLKLDGTKESILYTELSKSTVPYNKDIFTKRTGGRYSITELKVFHNNIEKSISFRNTDILYTNFTRNHRELRRYFLQGITLFRPDLSVSSTVYSNFFIHPETFEFDKKEFVKTVVLTAIIIIILLVTIQIYTKNRFGD
ncbi:hypothetical protein [Pseudopedobacter beijingensis]|uniref:Uncharacterized protein n=1 Tax=Pseudopedobacter beijingensis TaxID=1207056 RepID=A0ABW4IE95_9SPHI